MKKYLLSLLILNLVILPALSLAETITIQQPQALFEASQFGEFQEAGTGATETIEQADETALPRAKMVEPYPIEAPIASAIEKCGVNTFRVENECGIGAFKEAYFQCYDGYEEKQGGENACRSASDWETYAKKVCLEHCGIIEEPAPGEKPLPEIVEEVAIEAIPISVCYLSEALTDEYNGLLLKLRTVEAAEDAAEAARIKEMIIALKERIAQSREECSAGVAVPEPISPPESVRIEEPVVINRCEEVIKMEEKIAYYEKLRDMSEEAVVAETGLPKNELGIDNVIREMTESLTKLKEQCRVQNITYTSRALPIEQVPIAVVGNIDEQIQSLQSLREEIDVLIERLIKSRKEIEARELGNVVTEIKLSKGEIKADDVIVKTTAKKVLMDIGEKSISLEPTENNVLIKDSGLEVKAAEVSIQENVLRVGAAEVKMTASQVIEKINVSPKSVELKEEADKAVYEMAVDEQRKLFGFFPLTIQKTLTSDAANGDILREQRPWYAIFTSK